MSDAKQPRPPARLWVSRTADCQAGRVSSSGSEFVLSSRKGRRGRGLTRARLASQRMFSASSTTPSSVRSSSSEKSSPARKRRFANETRPLLNAGSAVSCLARSRTWRDAADLRTLVAGRLVLGSARGDRVHLALKNVNPVGCGVGEVVDASDHDLGEDAGEGALMRSKALGRPAHLSRGRLVLVEAVLFQRRRDLDVDVEHRFQQVDRGWPYRPDQRRELVPQERDVGDGQPVAGLERRRHDVGAAGGGRLAGAGREVLCFAHRSDVPGRSRRQLNGPADARRVLSVTVIPLHPRPSRTVSSPPRTSPS